MIKDEDVKKSSLLEIKENLNRSIENIRKLISQNNFEVLDLDSLIYEVKSFGEENVVYPMKFTLVENINHDFTYNLPGKKFAHIYYILQEGIINSIKHSNGTSIKLTIRGDESGLYFSVVDNGQGYVEKYEQREGHFGIKTMKQRSEIIERKFYTYSSGKGYSVVLYLPRRKNDFKD